MTLSTRSSISRTTLISTLCLLVLFSLVVFNTSCFSVRRPDLAWLDYDHDAASLTEATRVPKIISEAVDLPTNVHTFRDDGEVTVGTGAHRHPVLEILEHASSKWQSLLHAHGGDVSVHTRVYRLVITCSPPGSKHTLSCSIGHNASRKRLQSVSTPIDLSDVALTSLCFSQSLQPHPST